MIMEIITVLAILCLIAAYLYINVSAWIIQKECDHSEIVHELPTGWAVCGSCGKNLGTAEDWQKIKMSKEKLSAN